MFTLTPPPNNSLRSDVDPVRAIRLIRIQANVLLLLVLILAGTWVWFLRIKTSVNLHVVSPGFETPVQVIIDTMVFSGNDNITNTGISRNPFITLYGKIRDYGLLYDALPDLTVSVRGTRVSILPENGEFAEKVVLHPGQNTIDLIVWWDGISHHRQHYTVTYVPMTTSTAP